MEHLLDALNSFHMMPILPPALPTIIWSRSKTAAVSESALLCLYVVLLFSLIHAGRGEKLQIDTLKYYAEIENATARLFGKYPSGRVFREEYIEVSVTLVEELSSNEMTRDPSLITASFFSNSSSFTFNNTMSNMIIPGDPLVAAVRSSQEMRVANKGNLVIDISQFNGTATIPLGPKNITTVPNTVKMGFSCSNWTFQESSVAWRFFVDIVFYTENPLAITRLETWDPDREALKFELGTSKLNLTMWLQNWSVLDGQYSLQRPLPYTLSLASPLPGLIFTQGWQYTRFSSLIYDPDFSLLVTALEPAPVAQPSMEPRSVAPLDGIAAIDASMPTWIPVVIVIAVAVVAGVVLIVGLYLRHKTNRKAIKTLNNLQKKSAVEHARVQPRPKTEPPSSFAPPSAVKTGKSNSWAPADSKRATLRNAREAPTTTTK